MDTIGDDMETIVEARNGGRIIDEDLDRLVIHEYVVLKVRPVQKIAAAHNIARQQVYRILRRNGVRIVKKTKQPLQVAN